MAALILYVNGAPGIKISSTRHEPSRVRHGGILRVGGELFKFTDEVSKAVAGRAAPAPL